MRIMELYRIQNDYKNHKKRLKSIRDLNSKEKIQRITSHRFRIDSEIKKIKALDQTFREKEEQMRREHSLQLTNRTITYRNRQIKQQYDTIGVPLTSKKNCPSEQQEHLNELSHLSNKIAHMRSTYQRFRSRSEMDPEQEKSKKNEKEKILDLLKQHFKLEPQVVFPKTKGKVNHLESDPGQSALKKRDHLQSVNLTERAL